MLYWQPDYFPEATNPPLAALESTDIMEYFDFKMGEKLMSLFRINIYSVSAFSVRLYN